jgi:hypothetical protein
MIKKAVHRSLGRRVRGEDDKDPHHQDCSSRSAARRAPEYGHPRRSVVCTHLCTADPLAHSPRKRQNEWRRRQPQRRSERRGVGPVPPPPHRHARSHIQHDFYTYACGGLEDSAKIAKYCSTELASSCRPLPAPRPLARPVPDGVAWPGQHRSRSGSPARPCLHALGWSDTPPTLPTSEGLSSVAGSRRTR